MYLELNVRFIYIQNKYTLTKRHISKSMVIIMGVENLKIIIHFILSRMLSFINRFIPKDEKIIMFISHFEFGDNPRYLYEKANRMLKNHVFVWVVSNKKRFQSLEQKQTSFVQYSTLEYLKWILKAKYIVLGHNFPYWISKNQVSIQLWHGIPLKKIGNINTFNKNSKISFLQNYKNNLTNYFISTSSFSSIIFSAAFNMSLDKFIPLGQPRCDALFSSDTLNKNLLNHILNIDIRNYAYIIIYLPTFRDYNKDYTKKITESIILNENFKKFLSHYKILFLVKPHPKDEKILDRFSEKYIKILKNNDLSNNLSTIYDVLPAVDILVTDYSSIYFDYLLLNRPIVYYVPDLNIYKKTRGFLLEPYEKWTPGDKAKDIPSLIKALEDAINNPDKWKKEREWLRDIMFKYQDGKASERIIKYFWGDYL